MLGGKKFLILVLIAGFAMVACQTEMSETAIEEEDLRTNVAVLVAEGFHDGEAYMPIGYLINQGYNVTVIGPERGVVRAYNSDFTIRIDKAVHEVNVGDFEALVLPGGTGPSVLREDERVVDFVRNFWETGKVTAAICHGPQVLITAGVMEGKTSTGVGAIQQELEEAGVVYVDESVVIDGNLITSRIPTDLHDFSSTINKEIQKQLSIQQL